jgi:uncharacterized protein YcbK (DUF882 family)
VDIQRRKLIKQLSLLAVASNIGIPKILLAEDFSKPSEYDIYQHVDKYVPDAQYYSNLQRQQQQYIENQILPNGYGLDFWQRPRELFIQRIDRQRHINEISKVVYFENGNVNIDGYQKLCMLLRDVQQGIVVTVDLRLLDLMCATQAWLKLGGYLGPMMVHSGYRSPYTNSNTEGAAKNSMHMKAKAVDFSIPNFTTYDIAKIASQFKAGGIGLYPNRNFTHLDTGGVRVWYGK